jgi:large subunit ribosomal protein L5
MTQKEESKEQPRRRRRSKAEQDQPAAEAEKGQGEDQSSNGKAPEPSPPPRLLQRLRDEIGPQMTEEFSYKSPMQIPTLEKVVLNIGLGEALLNARAMEAATGDLTAISGQKPVTTRAKKSIAGFKIREGMAIGVSVTLRGRRMYEFMDRLLNSALPRIRDFQGVPRESFDGRGNFSLGIREQVIFPEIDYNSIDRIRGLQVAIVTTARNDQEGFRLLELLGMPFARTRDSLVA